MLSVLLPIVAVTSSSGSGPVEINYTAIADYGNHGGYTVSILETIRNQVQLNEYFSKTGYDTSRLTEKPDFDAVTGIGLVSKYGGGESIYSRTIQRIVDEGDTLIVETLGAVQTIPGISVQLGYQIVVVTIPKIDKPVILREFPATAAGKPPLRTPAIRSAQYKSSGHYNVQGRSVPLRSSRHNGLVICSDRLRSAKRMLLR